MAADMRTDQTEYRLSWEMGDAVEPAAIAIVYGGRDDRWTQLSTAQWDALIWRPVSRVDRDPPSQQYNALRAWAESHHQPIRNVRLERRPARADDEGWESYR